jgi:hypothetical protein
MRGIHNIYKIYVAFEVTPGILIAGSPTARVRLLVVHR